MGVPVVRPSWSGRQILSGVFEGRTTGAPISPLVRNADARPGAYDEMRDKFRPSHAEFTYQAKFGIRDHRGGGRCPARKPSAVWPPARLQRRCFAWPAALRSAHLSRASRISKWRRSITSPRSKRSRLRPCAARTPLTAARMIERIKAVRAEGDSVGGLIECRIRGVPAGLGEPVFDRLEADLARAMLSLPATKGFELGSGFAGTLLKGSEHNDLFENREGRVRTRTNRSGGVQGGISNGEEICFRVAFKPTATILRPQETVDVQGQPAELMGRGRHDPCVLPRAVPIVEAMAALVLVDHWMRNAAQNQTFKF